MKRFLAELVVFTVVSAILISIKMVSGFEAMVIFGFANIIASKITESKKERTVKMIKKGFTLIEVLVVAVIVAILAAVAVPVYSEYIEGSKDSTALNAANITRGIFQVEKSVYGNTDIVSIASSKITIPKSVEIITTADKSVLKSKNGGSKKYTVSLDPTSNIYEVVESDL